ncbi:ATP-binding protein [Spongiactinospora sp. TRM90649]|uniref:ATP-binding response regulator n=1 Tax=Spongiactinospora sp. TRM90649 TaxID=3031114 RepID=UPI0023F8AB84|nr:ATP-binding protein [Spongiactinospora sp. TRM90649]MDF5755765.1 ATP-binding protein [Spongiactinospora sp. TRM90649]
MSEELLRVRLTGHQDVFAIRRVGREIAERVGLRSQDQIRVATALSEVGREAFSADGNTSVIFSVDDDNVIITVDYPPALGIGASAGVVLAGRLVDLITIDEAVGHITMTKGLPYNRPVTDPKVLRAQLAHLAPVTALEELREQNRELAQTLEEVLRLNAELEETNQGVLALYNQLSAELEETNRGVVALYGELDEKSTRLREASDARKRFWATVSHELRTPLNSIIGLVRLMLGPGAEPLAEEQIHQVSLIGRSGETLLGLVDELLDMAKAEAGRLEPHASLIDVVALAEQLASVMRPSAGGGEVTLEVEVTEAAREIVADEVMLTRILRNLLSNALKFTERGSVRLLADLDTAAGEVVFTVADTGIGIPAARIEQVFEEFYQVPGPIQVRAKGTGLGLPYARRVAEALGGGLELRSEEGTGTTAVLRLPHGLGSPEIDRVLIADDDADFRALAGRMLAGVAANVDEATDGAEALALMRANPPDVVLVDLMMPRLDGTALRQHMAEDETLRGVPVVTVTHGSPEQSTDAILSKRGLRRDVLLAAVRAALDGRNA